jgi:hypothetical protein
VNVQDLQTVLHERAAGLDGSRRERLDELFDRIHARRRRWAAGAVAAVVVVVVVVVGSGALLRGSDQAAPPAGPPKPTHVVRTQQPVRPVVYIEGTPLLEYFQRQGRGPNGWRDTTLHYGDRALDPGVRFSWTDSTDGGLVLGREDGRIRFWSAASSTLRQIGTLGFRPHSYRASGLVRSDTSDSLVAWFDRTDASAPELVVYDTERQMVVVRRPARSCARSKLWWGTTSTGATTESAAATASSITSDCSTWTARQTPSPIGRPTSRSAAPATALVLTSRSGPGSEVVLPGPGLGLLVAKGRLTVAAEGNQPPLRGTPEVLYSAARDSSTGATLAPTVPTLYGDGAFFRFVQWLDDDRFALIGGGVQGHGDGHVLVCSIANQTCLVLAGGRQERGAVGLPLNFWAPIVGPRSSRGRHNCR